jgi:hypothetical protein
MHKIHHEEENEVYSFDIILDYHNGELKVIG